MSRDHGLNALAVAPYSPHTHGASAGPAVEPQDVSKFVRHPAMLREPAPNDD